MKRLIMAAAVPILATLAFGQPTVFNGGLVNAASFAAGQVVAPGSLNAIFGTQLADGLLINDTVPFSANLGDVTVTINGVPAPISFISPGQVNVQMPWDVLPPGTTSGTVNVMLTNSHGSSTIQVGIAPAAPGIFMFTPSGYAVAANFADGAIAAPSGAIPGVFSHPAAIGDILTLYATGLGAVDSTPANGAASPDMLRNTIAIPNVLIGGTPAQVIFHGLSPQFPAVNQINLIVSQGTPTGPSIPIQIQMGNITSTNQVLVAIQ
ncbi:MAG TPA: hypothetical protein VH639_22925 [Bryobacteraceae bacterium]